MAEHYRAEAWRPLLDAVLLLGLKCAYLLADAGRYLQLALDLCSAADSTLRPEDRLRVMQNVERLVMKGQGPITEPGESVFVV